MPREDGALTALLSGEVTFQNSPSNAIGYTEDIMTIVQTYVTAPGQGAPLRNSSKF